MAVYKVASRKVTPQNQPIPGSTQVKNSAGGYSWQLDDWGRLRRFLILGSEGGTYYIKEQDLLKQNADVLKRCLASDGSKTVNLIVEVSEKGLAYRNEAALFALATAASVKDEAVRRLALDALPKVARIGTHLFHWAHYINAQRGWGRALRNAVSNWYLEKTPDQLALQAVKYQQRDGWSHSDLLRLAHPVANDPAHDAVFRWMIGGKEALGERTIQRQGFKQVKNTRSTVQDPEAADLVAAQKAVKVYPSRLTALPVLIEAFEEAKRCNEKRLVELIVENGLPREAIPTNHLNSLAVWEALLVKMPATAMIRNLGKMSAIGLVKTLSKASRDIVTKLKDSEWLRKSRVHPLQFLIASKVYNQGHGEKGSLTWKADQSVVSALENAFYGSFGNVTPIGNNVLFSMDISSSMGQTMAGTCLSCYEAEAALALVHVNIEPAIGVMGFSHSYREIKLRKGMSLVDAMKHVAGQGFGGTDCSLPFRWAGTESMDVNSFVTTTDSETWSGGIHPSQALNAYRQASGNQARSVVVGMTSNGFTIADPQDAGSLDVVGFDASTPSLIADFCRGDI
jgi:60 kDa SS-A/Ro ribonucleoprotein